MKLEELKDVISKIYNNNLNIISNKSKLITLKEQKLFMEDVCLNEIESDVDSLLKKKFSNENKRNRELRERLLKNPNYIIKKNKIRTLIESNEETEAINKKMSMDFDLEKLKFCNAHIKNILM